MLDQVQAFLPQMAQANEKLRKEMAVAPAGHFNIENIDETSGNVIQMVTLAVFVSYSGVNILSPKGKKNDILKVVATKIGILYNFICMYFFREELFMLAHSSGEPFPWCRSCSGLTGVGSLWHATISSFPFSHFLVQ